MKTTKCPKCGGTGREICPVCGFTKMDRGWKPCALCKGEKTIKCKDCDGKGIVKTS